MATHIIRDRKFTIHTDHMDLTYMKQNPTSMVARWFIARQELDFTVHFVKGSDNELADALSRLCPNLSEIALPLTITRDVFSSSSLSSSSSTSVAALTVIEPATDELILYIQMCHNAIVGHNDVDRTLTRLYSLNQKQSKPKTRLYSLNLLSKTKCG